MAVNEPERAFFWDTTTNSWRKALLGEPGEIVWDPSTNSWVKGTIGAEYEWDQTTQSWIKGPGGQYVWNSTTRSWDKVTVPGYGGQFYWDATTNSWVKNSGYDAAALALAARMTTPPTAARGAAINALITALKSAGVWTKIDCLYLTAAADAQAAKLNWKGNASYDLVNQGGTPTFTADRGFTGTVTSVWLRSGFNPTTVPSPLFTQNNAHMGVWSRTNLTDGVTFGDIGNSNSTIGRNIGVSGQARGRPNTGSNVNIAAGGYPGHSVFARSGAALWESYVNGADAGGGTDASAALSSEELWITKNGVNQVAAGHWGSNLTAAEVLALYNALATYMTAVGA